MTEPVGKCALYKTWFSGYYSAPKAVDPNKTLDDVDPELLEMYKVRYLCRWAKDDE
jgi:hypothetical protein